jgi:gliding motility-associated-like protein
MFPQKKSPIHRMFKPLHFVLALFCFFSFVGLSLAQSPCNFTLEAAPISYSNCLAELNTEVVVSGGSGNFQYLWSNNTNLPTLSIPNPQSGVVSCLVYDVDENCTDLLVLDIVVPTDIGGKVIIIGDTLDCANRDRTIEALVNGGSNDLTFFWNTNDTTNPVILQPPFPEFVTVDIHDNVTGCDTTLVQNIWSIGAPEANFSVQDTVCPGAQLQIINQSDTTDAEGFIGYEWYLNGYEKSNYVIPEFSADFLGFTQIKLIIRDQFCTDSVSKEVVVLPFEPITSELIFQDDRFTEISILFPDVSDSCLIHWDDGDTTFNVCGLPDARHYYEDYGKFDIELSYVNALECKIRQVLSVDVIPQLTVFFPDAFSPDGDGINETFGPFSDELDKVDSYFVIYNRNGLPVFISGDPEERWDGTYNGSKAPEGYYRYLYVYKPEGSSDNNKGEIKGTLLLMR